MSRQNWQKERYSSIWSVSTVSTTPSSDDETVCVPDAFLVEPGGYPEKVFLGAFNTSLKCNICLLVLRDPLRVCVNDHQYCRSCIPMIANNSCPECRTAISVTTPARVLRDIINDLPVKCFKGIDSKCSWVGKVEALEAHVALCEFVNVTCSITDCDVIKRRGKMSKHEAVCSHGIVRCSLCRAKMKRSTLDNHMSSCPNRIVSCVNVGCDEKVPLNKMANHRGECPYEVVACPLLEVMQCPHRCTRRLMPAHSADMASHFACLTDSLRHLQVSQAQLQVSEAQLQRYEARIAQLERSEAQLRQETVQLRQETVQLRQEVNQLRQGAPRST